MDHKTKNTISNLGYKMMSLSLRLKEKVFHHSRKLRHFHLRKGDTVVDYGCGPGIYIHHAANMVGPKGNVFACDIHPLAIKDARSIIHKYKLKNVFPVLVKDQFTSLERSSADVVYALDMFHMVGDKHTMLNEIHRIIKPEGHFYLEDGHQSREKTLDAVTSSQVWMIMNENSNYLTLVPK
jgi:ubiquinone/menaquinone biosynthesis C-methylase UbiE